MNYDDHGSRDTLCIKIPRGEFVRPNDENQEAFDSYTE